MAKASRPTAEPALSVRPERSWFSVVAALALLVAGTWFCWRQAGNSLSSRGDYRIEAHEIQLTERPPWVRDDIRNEALRDAALDPPLSLLDETLPGRLAQAFAMHPWVEQVRSVRVGYPSWVNIELVYRRPVAMVEVAGGLLPVDARGVQLPPRDFDGRADVGDYPRLVGVTGGPISPLGTVWSDPIVQAGAAVAAVVQPYWKRGDFARLRYVEEAPQFGRAGRYFVLETRSGENYLWGQPPGREPRDEASAEVKAARLEKLLIRPAGGETTTLREYDLRPHEEK